VVWRGGGCGGRTRWVGVGGLFWRGFVCGGVGGLGGVEVLMWSGRVFWSFVGMVAMSNWGAGGRKRFFVALGGWLCFGFFFCPTGFFLLIVEVGILSGQGTRDGLGGRML